MACHILFALAVGGMIAGMAFGMSRGFGALPAPWGAMTDAALLLQFPLGHSLLLSRRGRRLLGRLAPRGLGAALSTTTYAAIASAQVALLFLAWTPSGIVWWRASGASLALTGAAYTSAWLLLLKAISDAGMPLQLGITGWWAVARGRKPVYPPMPRRGLFRLCRQPIYLAFALTLWTVPCWTPDQLVVATVLTLYCVAGPILKERRFAKFFGAEWASYRACIPYFVPSFRWRRAAAGEAQPSASVGLPKRSA